MKKPNIVVVIADQMRAGSLGFAGQEHVLTPRLEAFSNGGTWFRKAVSNNPACSPARAGLLTGLYPLRHGIVNNDVCLGTDFTTLAHHLNGMDYQCGYIGKWHLDSADRGIFVPPGSRRQGFDDYWAAYNCNHRYHNGYYYLNDNPEPIWIDGYEPFEQTRLAEDYLRQKSRGENPFCLFVSYGPPHCPYLDVPQEYLDLYPPEEIQLRPNTGGAAGLDKQVLSGYYAHITALDHCFGQLMDCLEETGLEEDTIVLFLSDHGDMLFSQNRGWKSKPWNESVNIPFLVRWPGHIPAGRVSDGLVSLVDVMPTLVSLVEGSAVKDDEREPADCGNIPDCEGSDLSNLFLGDENASPESAFIGFYVIPDDFSYTEWRGIVTKQYTYARFRDRPWILYDDVEDPYQQNNLIEDPRFDVLREELDRQLDAWMEDHEDAFETSKQLADRYSPGHIGGVVPYYENEVILQGVK